MSTQHLHLHHNGVSSMTSPTSPTDMPPPPPPTRPPSQLNDHSDETLGGAGGDILPGEPQDHNNNNRPWSSRFLDADEDSSNARRTYIKILCQRTGLIIVALFAIFSIYWGALCKIPARQLEGWVVDFDGDTVGKTVVGGLVGLSNNTIYWKVQPASRFPKGEIDVADALIDEKAWVIVAVHAGATQALNRAIQNKIDPSYNAASAITAYGVEARNENAFRAFVRPVVDAWLHDLSYKFSISVMQDIARNSSATLAEYSPALLSRPVYYTFNNLRPFDVPVAQAVTFVGLIYLLILAFFVVNSAIMARTASGLDKRLTLGSLVQVRILTAMLIYLILSCFYTLLCRAFQLPFHRKFGPAGFVIFWMISWFGMMAAGLALEAMITLLTVKYVQIFLLLWIISNVSICLWPLELLPKVYGYGYAAPFYQIGRGVRTIVFRTRNEVGLNFGILIVWITISCISLPLIQWYRRREDILAWEEERRKVNRKLES